MKKHKKPKVKLKKEEAENIHTIVFGVILPLYISLLTNRILIKKKNRKQNHLIKLEHNSMVESNINAFVTCYMVELKRKMSWTPMLDLRCSILWCIF